MKNQKQNNKNLCSGGVKWYREKIFEMVQQVEDVWILEQIHKFVINMTKEGS